MKIICIFSGDCVKNKDTIFSITAVINLPLFPNLLVEEVLEGNVTNKDQWIRSVLQSNDALYMPIPQSEIDVNPLLKQNPYYTN